MRTRAEVACFLLFSKRLPRWNCTTVCIEMEIEHCEKFGNFGCWRWINSSKPFISALWSGSREKNRFKCQGLSYFLQYKACVHAASNNTRVKVHLKYEEEEMRLMPSKCLSKCTSFQSMRFAYTISSSRVSRNSHFVWRRYLAPDLLAALVFTVTLLNITANGIQSLFYWSLFMIRLGEFPLNTIAFCATLSYPAWTTCLLLIFPPKAQQCLNDE